MKFMSTGAVQDRQLISHVAVSPSAPLREGYHRPEYLRQLRRKNMGRALACSERGPPLAVKSEFLNTEPARQAHNGHTG